MNGMEMSREMLPTVRNSLQHGNRQQYSGYNRDLDMEYDAYLLSQESQNNQTYQATQQRGYVGSSGRNPSPPPPPPPPPPR